jgi:transcription-repair coupling factor (superfamily II helicase)
LRIVALKALCRRANVEKVETGPKGAVLSFRNGEFVQSGRLGRLHPRRGGRRARAARHEGRVLRRLAAPGAAAQGRQPDPAPLVGIAEQKKAA